MADRVLLDAEQAADRKVGWRRRGCPAIWVSLGICRDLARSKCCWERRPVPWLTVAAENGGSTMRGGGRRTVRGRAGVRARGVQQGPPTVPGRRAAPKRPEHRGTRRRSSRRRPPLQALRLSLQACTQAPPTVPGCRRAAPKCRRGTPDTRRVESTTAPPTRRGRHRRFVIPLSPEGATRPRSLEASEAAATRGGCRWRTRRTRRNPHVLPAVRCARSWQQQQHSLVHVSLTCLCALACCSPVLAAESADVEAMPTRGLAAPPRRAPSRARLASSSLGVEG